LELEDSGVDTGEVASAGWLVLLWLECEGVHVDADGWHVGVVLPWLHEVEVRAETLRETVVTVELDLGTDDWVATSVDWGETRMIRTRTGGVLHAEVHWGERIGDSTWTLGELVWRLSRSGVVGSGTSEGWSASARWVSRDRLREGHEIGERSRRPARLDVGAERSEGSEVAIDEVGEGVVVIIISVVRPLVDAWLNDRITLDDPDEFLHWMVEVHLDLHVLHGDRLITSELNLLDEVFVRNLGETTTLVSVEINVIDIERRSLERWNAESRRTRNSDVAVANSRSRNIALALRAELEVDLHLMILYFNTLPFGIFLMYIRSVNIYNREWTIP